MNYYRNVPEQDMENYTLPPRINQAPQSIKSIFFTIQMNTQGSRLKTLANTTHYAIGTVSNGLQTLKKLGLIYFNKVLRCWFVRTVKQKTKDIYDAYIMYKQDIKEKAINLLTYVFGDGKSRLYFNEAKNYSRGIKEVSGGRTYIKSKAWLK